MMTSLCIGVRSPLAALRLVAEKENLEAKAAKATAAVVEPGAARAMEAWRFPSLNV